MNPRISQADVKAANMKSGCHVCSRVDSEQIKQVIFYMKHTAKNRHYEERGFLESFNEFIKKCVETDKNYRVFRLNETFGMDEVQFSKYKNAATTKYSFTIEHRLVFASKSAKKEVESNAASPN